MINLKFGVLVLGLLFFNSCTKNDINPATEFFRFMDNSQVIHITSNEEDEILHSFQIDGGENFVFQYEFNEEESSGAIDDEYGYRFTFEVDKDAESFEIENADLSILKAHFQEVGAWVSHKQIPVLTGKITGQKLSATRWSIQINVTAEDPSPFGGEPIEIIVDATFEK